MGLKQALPAGEGMRFVCGGCAQMGRSWVVQAPTIAVLSMTMEVYDEGTYDLKSFLIGALSVPAPGIDDFRCGANSFKPGRG